MVYTMTNAPGGNQVLAFERGHDGTLTPAGAFDTGGNGDGLNLGSQGSVVLSENGRYLAAVNAGSGSVSLFGVRNDGLELVDTASDLLTRPVSAAFRGNLLVVLNGGSASRLVAFRIHRGGLEFVPESPTPLGGDVAQVSFTPDGRHVAVTIKDLNAIATYRVTPAGQIVGADIAATASAVPFGFAFDRSGHMVVSEAAQSALSVYDIDRDGFVSLVDGPVPDGQAAACWVVVSKNGRFAYTANAGSASISSYAIGHDGSLTLLDAVAGQTATQPLDMGMSNNGRYLYVVSRVSGVINGFEVGHDGSLTPIETEAGIPATSFGLAAN
jgi:6-phosphogluconolactonase (cycloisomerase 2 family)